MEQKRNNMFLPLLLNALKSKRNWFFLSTVILFITTSLIPYILGVNNEAFVVFGLVEVFALVFINCLVDNSFLHNDVKLAYYKSKPATFKSQISINLIVNLIFAAFLMLLIVLSVVMQKLDYRIIESYKSLVPWLTAGIFLASLSSILAGSTLVAGAMTIFNFALPGIIYLVIQFMFSILENVVSGFSSIVLMDYFVNKVYKLDYIYFVRYVDIPMDLTYFLILGIILMGISILIFKMIKRRKNENTGNFMAFNGYKYFVSVLASLIIPAFFSIISYGGNIVNEIIVSLLMAVLTYYIIIAVMDKSFRISKLSIKVFVASMIVFMAVTGVTIIVANQYKDVVPETEDIKMAYVGNNRWSIQQINRYIEENGTLEDEDFIKIQRDYGMILFTDKNNIETITELHKDILNNQSYKTYEHWMSNLVITYFMNDGSYIIRDYRLEPSSNSNSEIKDILALELFNSQELKERKYYYLYNGNADLSKYNIQISLTKDSYDGTDYSKVLNIDEIRPHLIKDLNDYYFNLDNAFMTLLNYNYELPFKEMGDSAYYIEVIVRSNQDDHPREGYERLYLDKDFQNTREYLNQTLNQEQ